MTTGHEGVAWMNDDQRSAMRAEAAEKDEDDDEPGTVKRRTTDPMLRILRDLDWLIADLEPQMRSWAIGWLQAKYGAKA